MKRKLLILLLLSLSFVAFSETKDMELESENATLNLATEYYDSGDYANAKKNYIKTIMKGSYNGTIFYRLGYCLESLQENNSLMKKCYEASYYCFYNDSENDNPYFQKSKSKISQFNLNNNISETDLKKTIFGIAFDNFWNILQKNWFIFLIVGIIIYIGAYKLAKNTKCVILYGWKDVIMIGIGVFFFVCLQEAILDDPAGIIIPMIFFFISALFSLLGNIRGSGYDGIVYVVLYTLASLIAKTVLLVVIPLFAISWLFAATSGEKDGRYKDGTKNNAKTANIAFVSAMLTLLFKPLIKSKKDLKS